MLATSDLPGGVVNLLTGFRKELVPTFATHAHLRAIFGVANADERKALALGAADSVKRARLVAGRGRRPTGSPTRPRASTPSAISWNSRRPGTRSGPDGIESQLSRPVIAWASFAVSPSPPASTTARFSCAMDWVGATWAWSTAN